MKLNCTVQLRDKELCYSTKWRRSVVSFEKKVDSYKIEAYLVWEAEKKNQIKYLISTKDLYNFSNNIKTIKLMYSNSKNKHIKNVKIYFKFPHYKLTIRGADYDSLKRFNTYMTLTSLGRWLHYEETLGSKIKITLKTSHVVTKKEDYPPRKGFPKTTEILVLQNLNITELNVQIFVTLKSLTCLSLAFNKISFLPKELGTLPNLEMLHLSNNCFGNTCLDIAKWEWMEQTAISQSLKHLHININNLTKLPLQIGKLQSLVRLDVSENLLTKVPQIIGTLQQLQWLDVSKNRLTYLPGSMRGMELGYFDAANNPFKDLRVDEYRSPTLKVVSLLDLAAKAVKKYRIPYNKLLSTLVRYLDNCKYCCICRNPCFHSDITDFKFLLGRPTQRRNVNLVSDVCEHPGMVENRQTILFKCYFCSSKCYAYFCKTH